MEELRHKLDEEEKNSYKANQELYKLFNDLQGIAKEYEISNWVTFLTFRLV